MISSLYIHIPFCKKKCNYCDFLSYAGKEDQIDEYVEALVREINSPPLSPSLIKRGGNRVRACRGRGGGEFETIYFGGGTPTLLEPKHFNKIINSLIRHSSLGIRHSEITVEANPGTADRKKLKALRELGINRLSIGVQSFNDKHLKTLGRIHDAETAKQFYRDARSAGFENVNLDLIFALPGQTLDEWKNDLQTAINLNPNHLSTYNLQIEENTPLHDQLTTYPSQETDLAMYEYAIETLANAGYRHYEISNFAKPGFECRHNINYWKMGHWLGIGEGAKSHLEGNNDTKGEIIFMGLRLLEGLPAAKFTNFKEELKELIDQGLLEKSGENIKFTRKGLLLGNLVFEKFI